MVTIVNADTLHLVIVELRHWVSWHAVKCFYSGLRVFETKELECCLDYHLYLNNNLNICHSVVGGIYEGDIDSEYYFPHMSGL